MERQKGGKTKGWKDRRMERQRAKNYVPSLFFEKARDNKLKYSPISIVKIQINLMAVLFHQRNRFIPTSSSQLCR